MKLSARPVILQILYTVSLIKCEWSFTHKEFEVVKILGTSLGIKYFTFVQNHEVDLIRKIRMFPESHLFSTAVNSKKLLDIIDGTEWKSFFADRTILVTKENLNFTSLLNKLSAVHSANWLVFVKSPSDMNEFYIPINTNFFIAHKIRNTIVINEAFHIKPGLGVLLRSIGTWSGEKKKNFIAPKERINFEKNTLNVLYFFSQEECDSRKLTDILNKIECYQQNILDIFAERLNFTINKIQCQERTVPYNFPNGTLSEMFTALSSRRADLSSGSYVINNHRLVQFDFAWPAFTTRSMMYIKLKSTKSSWRAYLRPMNSSVWKAIVSWAITTGLLMKLFKILRSKNYRFRLSLIPELIESVLISFQLICNQGLPNMTRWYSTRLIFLLTFFLFVCLYQAYSGFLISSLTVAVPDLPFTDINGFFRDGTYKMMTLRTGFHYYHVRKILKENKKKIKDLMLDEDELPKLTKEGIQKLCTQRKLVFVEYRENTVQYEIPCKILEIHKPLLYQSTGLGLPKNSPYKDIINKQLNRLRSNGILNRMRENLLPYVNLKRKETSYTRYINVSLKHVISIFFILGIGAVISIIIFLLEIAVHILTKSKYFNKQPCKKQKKDEWRTNQFSGTRKK